MASSTGALTGRGRRRVRALGLMTSVGIFALTSGIAAPAAAQVSADIGVTPPGVDVVATLPALAITDVTVTGPSTARVTASVDPQTTATSIYFEYGQNGVFNLTTPKTALGVGATPSQVAADLFDLEPGESYSVRMLAETPSGTIAGPPLQFTTPARQRARFVTVAGKRLRCTVVGTARGDKLNGTRKRDVICGLAGSDRINGRGGNDVIVAGSGNDRIVGGTGHDRMYGNAGRDRLVGNRGRDHLFGGAGRDQMVTSGDRRRGDRLHGGSGRDVASANRGDRARSVERMRRR
jgi:RTX calcium-binding nonapeptide repeat (4 copies)